MKANGRGQSGFVGALVFTVSVALVTPIGAQDNPSPVLRAAERESLAESILAAKERAMGEPFDPSIRAYLRTRMEGLPMEQLTALAERGEAADVPAALGSVTSDLVYTPVIPCRVFDSRPSAGGPGPIPANTQRNVVVAGTVGFPAQGGLAGGCGVPVGATSAIINFVTVLPAGPGNIRAWAVANPQPPAPLAAVMNYGTVTGLPAIANGVAVPLCNPAATDCSGGDLRLQADTSATNILGDVVGYFGPAVGGFVDLTTAQTVGGSKTFSSPIVGSVTGSAASAATATTVAGLTCATGQVVKWSGPGWTCGTDDGLIGSLAGEVTGTQAATVVSNAVPANTPTAIVRRDASGNFSAGTATLGGIRLTPSPGLGKVMTSDATGNGSWQAVTGAAWGLGGNAGTAGSSFLGTTDNAPLELRVNGARGLRLEPDATAAASANLIGGSAGNVATSGVRGAAIGGGGAVIPGQENRVTDDFGVVGGGANNQAGDGLGSTTDRSNATVGGGYSNLAGGAYSTVSGGIENVASGGGATVSGGYQSTASGPSAFAVGYGNLAGGAHSFAAGRSAKVRDADPSSSFYSGDADGDEGTFVWSDYDASAVLPLFMSTGPNQFLVRAQGGVGINKNNPATALDVAGTITASGLAVNGSPSWTGTATGSLTASTITTTGLTVNGSPSWTGTASGSLTASALMVNGSPSWTGTASGNLTASAITAAALTVNGSPTWTGTATGNLGATNITGTVAIANGGTGSTTKNFVDLTTAQTVGGNKSLTGTLSLVASTPIAGNILKGGSLFIHNSGSENTFIGVTAGNLTVTGTGNTGSGKSALENNSSGNYNTATGVAALRFNTTAGRNTALGTSALEAQSFSNADVAWDANNTAVGFHALLNNQPTVTNNGIQNTAVGSRALATNTTGAFNVATGFQALEANSTGDSNTASGVGALGSNIDGSYNSATGSGALRLNTSGSFNAAFGQEALFSNGTGSRNTGLGYQTDVASGALTNATAIGFGAVVNASNKIRLGNTAVTVIEGQVAYTFPSDRTKKENIRAVDAQAVLGKLRDLDVTSWNYIGHDPKEFRHYGPMAQDFFAAFGRDEVGAVGTDTTINSGDITGVVMIALKGLDAQVLKDQRTIAAQAAEISSLKQQTAEIASLKQQFANLTELLKTLRQQTALTQASQAGGK